MTRFNELGVVVVGVAGRVGRPPGRRADLEQCRWDLRQVVAARKTVLEAGWPHLCEFVALAVAWPMADLAGRCHR
jgi:hypothetical protein